MEVLLHGDLLAPEGLLQDAYLGVSDGAIDYVGRERPEKAYAQEKDMRGKLLLPGLVNAHTHAAMTLLRGVGSDLPLHEWLFDCIVPIEDRYTDADFRAGNRLALLEMIRTGTTSFTDMYFQSHIMAEEMLDCGMKGNIDRCVQGFDPAEDPAKNRRVRECIALYDDYNGAGNGLVRVDFNLHAVYTCTEGVIRYMNEVCAECGGRMHLHLAESDKEMADCLQAHGKTPTRYLYDLGTFDNPAYAAHCVALTPEDIALLQEKNVSAVHNPTSNMKLGNGFAPIPDLHINVALGTDGAASNNNLDLFEEMHLAALIHKGVRKAPAILKAKDVFSMATRGGALAQGRADTGALAVGMRADVAALDMDAPHLVPAADPYTAIVYAAHGSDVCMTMVEGKILYENGAFFTLDAEKIKYEARAAAKRLRGE